MEYIENKVIKLREIMIKTNNIPSSYHNQIISSIEDFVEYIDNDDSLSIYNNIHNDIVYKQLKYNNIIININFEKLEKLYPRAIFIQSDYENFIFDEENIYFIYNIPQTNKKFIEKQLKILNKFDF